MELYRQSARTLSPLLMGRQLSAAELARDLLDRVEATEHAVGAMITVRREALLREAAQTDDRRAKGESLPPLAGLPIAVKDNICTRGLKTTCASRMLADFVPSYDAAVMEKLRAAGLLLIGKTNLDEFAMGATGETSYFGKTHNPYDLKRVSGGSSSGSAAAVAAGQSPLALGSDTGGSVRIPASFCGHVGLRPTYGAVSRFGLVAAASSMDQIGPMARDVFDTAMLYDVICGYDGRDSTSANRDYVPVAPHLTGEIRGLRIGIPGACFDAGVQPDILTAMMSAARQFEDLGAHVMEVSLPDMPLAVPTYYASFCAEAASNLARYDGVRYGYRADGVADVEELYRKSRSQGFGREVQRRLMVGAYLTSEAGRALYTRARRAAQGIRRAYKLVFSQCDLLLTPTAPVTAPPSGLMADKPMSLTATNFFTSGVSLAGLPALSVPCGTDGGGLPIGLQLIGPHFGEQVIFNAAYAFEQSGERSDCTARVEGVDL